MFRSLAVAGSLLVLAPVGAANDLVVPDAFPTIQAAVDAAQPGDVILVKKGTYASATISGKTNVILKKASGKPVIEVADTDEAGIHIVNSDGIRISGFEFRGGVSEGVYATLSTDVTIEKCKAVETGDGIVIEDSTHVLVRKCTVTKPQLKGIYVTGGNTVTIQACKVNDALNGSAIYATQSNLLTLTQCRVTNTRDGISVKNAPNSVITDNRVTNVTSDYAMDVSGDFTMVTDNVVKQCLDEPAIRLDGAQARAEWNYVVKSYGAYELGGSDCFFLNNTSKKCVNGTYIGGANHYVLGNYAKSMKFIGMRIGADGCIVEGNICSKNKQRGLQVDGTGNSFKYNVAKKNKEFDLYDTTGVGTNSYFDNKFNKILIID